MTAADVVPCAQCGRGPSVGSERHDGKRVWVARCCADRIESDSAESALRQWAFLQTDAPRLDGYWHSAHYFRGFVQGCISNATEQGTPAAARVALHRIAWAAGMAEAAQRVLQFDKETCNAA